MNAPGGGSFAVRPAWRPRVFFACGGLALILATSLAPGLVETAREVASGGAAAAERPTLVLAALAISFVWALPGLALVLATGRVQRASQAVVLGFPLAHVVHIALPSLQRWLVGDPLEPLDAGLTTTLASLVALVTLVAYLVRRRRAPLPGPITLQDDPRADLRFSLCACAAVAALLFLFFDKVFVENLNDDGLEALYIGQSLSVHHLPRFPTDSGLVGVGVGMFSQSWLTHAFGSWFGFGEAAPRLPFVLGFVLCLAALVELIELRAPRRLRIAELASLTLGLSLFALVICTSAGYDPYFCELSSPGAYEFVLLGCVLGGYAAWQRGNHVALFTYMLLAHLARPTGLLLFVMFAAALFVLAQGRRREGLRVLPGLLACIAFSLLYEQVYAPWVLDGAALPYGAGSILERFHFLTLTDVRRIAFAAVPCGLVPFVTLFLWKRLDGLGRVLALVCVAYLALFFVPAFVSLHHYAPLMVLPLVPFWRGQLAHGWGNERRALLLVAAGLVLGFWISWPASLAADRSLASFGARIVDTRPSHPPGTPGARAHARMLDSLALLEEPGVDPGARFVVSSWNLEHYARTDPPGAVDADFRVLARGATPPAGWERRATQADFILWAAPGAGPDAPPPTSFGAALYRIPREVLFRHLGIPAEAYDWSPRKSFAGW